MIYILVLVVVPCFYLTKRKQFLFLIILSLSSNIFGLTSSAPDFLDNVVLEKLSSLAIFSVFILSFFERRQFIVSLIFFVLLYHFLKAFYSFVTFGSDWQTVVWNVLNYSGVLLLILRFDHVNWSAIAKAVFFVTLVQTAFLIVANIFDIPFAFRQTVSMGSEGLEDRYGIGSRFTPLIIFAILSYGKQLGLSLVKQLILVVTLILGVYITDSRTLLLLSLMSVPFALLNARSHLTLAVTTILGSFIFVSVINIGFEDIYGQGYVAMTESSHVKGNTASYRIAQVTERFVYLKDKASLVFGIPYHISESNFTHQFQFVPKNNKNLETADISYSGLLLRNGIVGIVLMVLTIITITRRLKTTRDTIPKLFILTYVLLLSMSSGFLAYSAYVVILLSFVYYLNALEKHNYIK